MASASEGDPTAANATGGKRRLEAPALVVFLATLGLNWPFLPLNIRLADLLFVPLVVLLVLHPGSRRTATARPALGFLDFLVAAYVVGSLPSLLATTDLRSSLIELLRHLYVVGIYAAVALAVTRGHLDAALKGMAAGPALLALLGVAFTAACIVRPFEAEAMGTVLNLPYAGPVLRLRALTATPAMLACLLTIAVPFAIVNAITSGRPRSRRLWTAASLVMAVAAVLTVSHVLAGFAVAALIAAWPVLQARRALRRAAVLAVVAMTILANLSVVASIRRVAVDAKEVVIADSTDYFHAIDEGQLHIGPVRIVYEAMSYFRIKEVAWDAFRAQPLTGVGLDRFHDVTERAHGDGRLPVRYRAIDPHSALLGRLAETGIAGGLTLALLWAGIVVTGTRAIREPGAWPRRAAFAGLAGLLVAGINVDIMNFRFFWAALGLLRGVAITTFSRGAVTSSRE